MRENASITTKRRSIEVRMTSRLRKTRRDEVVLIITTGGKIAEAMIAAITMASTAAMAVADIDDEDAEVTRINETLSEKNETQITKMSETSREEMFSPVLTWPA
jgi:deoxyhypusine synthase